MAKEVSFPAFEESVVERRSSGPIPPPRVILRGMFGAPPSLDSVTSRLASGTLLTKQSIRRGAGWGETGRR